MGIGKRETMKWQRVIKTKREEEEDKDERKEEDTSSFFNMSLVNCCTHKTSVQWTVLLVLHLGCVFSQGREIDFVHHLEEGVVNTTTDHVSEHANESVVLCEGSGQPLQFRLPNDKEFNQMDSGVVKWTFLPLDWEANNQTTITMATLKLEKGQIDRNASNYTDGYKPWDTLGVEVTNPAKKDDGYYTLHYGSNHSFQNNTPVKNAHVRIYITGKKDLPTLSTKTLELTAEVKNGMVELNCGTIHDTGRPSIQLQLKTSEEVVLSNFTFTGTTVYAAVPVEKDIESYVCEIDYEKVTSAECLSEEERSAWKVSVANPAFEPEETSFLGTYIIPIVAGGTLAVVVAGGALYMMAKSSGDAAMAQQGQHRGSQQRRSRDSQARNSRTGF